MMLVSLISYIDRNALALLAPTILKETNLSGEQYGWIVSAFSVAYMIGNPTWGLALDRFGIRYGMMAAVVLWSAASASHALAAGFWGFVAARTLLGFGEGATFPGGMRTAAETLPVNLRARGIALAYSGGSLGAVLTPIIITPVSLRWGWRGAFIFTGLIGLAWLVLWVFSSPRTTAPAARHTAVPAENRLGFSEPGLWAFISAYALGALPLAFVLYSAALYLGKVRGFSQADLGAVLWIPPLGWEVGYFFWGWVADRFGPLTGNRARLIFGLLAIFSLPLAAGTWIPATGLLLFLLFFAMFVAAGFVIVAVAYATRIFGTGHAGLIAGAGAGSWGAVVAVFMPVAGRLFDRALYSHAFLLASIIPLCGFLLWLLLDRARRRAAIPVSEPALR